MATRDVSTTSASTSLGGSAFTSQVNTLNAKFTANTLIQASHIVDLANLLIQAAGHTHDWTDQFGLKSYGNTNPNGYSNRGSREANNVNAMDTNFGLLDGVSSGEVVNRAHANYCITVYNALRNHKHSTEDATS